VKTKGRSAKRMPNHRKQKSENGAALFLCVGLAMISPLLQAQQDYSFGACANQSPAQYEELDVHSLYIPMRDGVRIAVDVVLPQGLAKGKKIPAILSMTRYWRAHEGESASEIASFFAQRGYAFITGDSRGTGASFGMWRYHRNPDETRDFGEILTWIVAQPWSSGKVGAMGTSYGANTADWVAQNNNPAVKAIIPRFPDFDPYTDLYFPGGIFHLSFGQAWSRMVRSMDLNVPFGSPPKGVKPVDADVDHHLLLEAIQERAGVPQVYEGLKQITFRDDRPTTWNASMKDWSISSHLQELESSHVAIYSWGSWFDSGTANGILERFSTLSNAQRAVIGPWSHGAQHHASPYQPPGTETDPAPDRQMAESLCYFDHYLKGIQNGMSEKILIYYTMAEETWKTTRSWPPSDTRIQRWYLTAHHALSQKQPQVSSSAMDRYRIDFDANTGLYNRWHTQTGQAVNYSDRAQADRHLLTYTSPPLSEDLEITGNPVVTLFVSTTANDGAVFVYFEDITPEGKALYLTEGELRLLHRKVSREPPPYKMFAPYHSFLRKDASPVVPGKLMKLSFGMLPTSVLLRKGHRIRIAIAGADRGTFVRIPEKGTPTILVFRSNDHRSFVDLPAVTRH
jgi:uncharacterized protein